MKNNKITVLKCSKLKMNRNCDKQTKTVHDFNINIYQCPVSREIRIFFFVPLKGLEYPNLGPHKMPPSGAGRIKAAVGPGGSPSMGPTPFPIPQ